MWHDVSHFFWHNFIRDAPFSGVTEACCLLLFTVAINRDKAYRLLFLMGVDIIINVILKYYFQHPLPPPMNHSFGLPSGHTQFAVVVWGAFFFEFFGLKKSILLTTLIVLYAGFFVNLYNNFHYVIHIVAAIIVAVSILVIFYRYLAQRVNYPLASGTALIICVCYALFAHGHFDKKLVERGIDVTLLGNVVPFLLSCGLFYYSEIRFSAMIAGVISRKAAGAIVFVTGGTILALLKLYPIGQTGNFEGANADLVKLFLVRNLQLISVFFISLIAVWLVVSVKGIFQSLLPAPKQEEIDLVIVSVYEEEKF